MNILVAVFFLLLILLTGYYLVRIYRLRQKEKINASRFEELEENKIKPEWMGEPRKARVQELPPESEDNRETFIRNDSNREALDKFIDEEVEHNVLEAPKLSNEEEETGVATNETPLDFSIPILETEGTTELKPSVEKDVIELEKSSTPDSESTISPTNVATLLQDHVGEVTRLGDEIEKERVHSVDSEQPINFSKEDSEQRPSGRFNLIDQIPDRNIDVGVDITKDDIAQSDESPISNTEVLGAPDLSMVFPAIQEESGDINKPSQRKKKPLKPRRYTPPIRISSVQSRRRSSTRSDAVSVPNEGYKFPIAIHVYFRRGDFIQVSLLLGRNPDIPDEITAIWGGQEINLFAITNEWFEGISPGNLGNLLEIGIEWETEINEGRLIRWSLSGRPIYVLSTSNALSGFISTTRIVLGGENQVILCKKELLQNVLSIITETGSQPPEVLGIDAEGLEGWVCLRNVIPKLPVTQEEGQDILNILRPLPDIEIDLENGIRIENSVWLIGYPPKIHVRGDINTVDNISIDGVQAVVGSNGVLSAPGWDLPGDHNIFAGGKNKSYSIREGGDAWKVWEAYINPRRRVKGRAAICGPLVFSSDNSIELNYPFMVPSQNTVMIGAIPGEIYNCQISPEEKAITFGDFSPFQPVWALPSNPLNVNKYLARVLFVGEVISPQKLINIQRLDQTEKESILKWANIILAAGRKGLSVEPPTPEIEGLWRMYKQQAKAIWKFMR